MPAAGDRIGPWTLLEPLGRGGNATVWKASRTVDDDVIALKVLDVRRPTSERYIRFRDEIAVLQTLTGEPGILPLLDHHLPDAPTGRQPAWLAMPVAIPIQDALGARPNLEDVVAVGAEIATTLARLADRGISHRDIKPGNLYEYSGTFVIGDFGLVRFPDKGAITTDDRSLGPRNFLAPEMISGPEDADGSAADVYSLAKTIWALAAHRRWPPPGHQLVESVSTNLASRVPHPRVREVDWIIERATAHDPSERITMREVAANLRAWIEPGATYGAVLDLAEIGERYRGQVADRDRMEVRQRRWLEQATQLLTGWGQALTPVAAELRRHGFGAKFDPHANNVTFVRDGDPNQRPSTNQQLWSQGRCILVSPPGSRNLLLWIGLGMLLFQDGGLCLTVGTQIRTAGGQCDVLSLNQRQVHIDSPEVRHHVADLGNALVTAVPAAVQRFTEEVEASRVADDPLSALRLSPTVSGIVSWLNRESEHAVEGFDSFDPDRVRTLFALPEAQLLEAVAQIESRGWLDVHRAAGGTLVADIASLRPTPLLFIDTDPYLRGWDPRHDAECIANLLMEQSDGQAVVVDLARRLGWEPRRMNPALYVLVRASAIDPSPPSSGAHPFAYDDFLVTARTRRFRANHNRDPEGETGTPL